MKKLIVAAIAASFVGFAFADSASNDASKAEKPVEAEAAEEEEDA